METFSALLAICAGNSSVPGEFPAQRPVKHGFDVVFDLRLNKRLTKQSRGWWFETLPHPLWCHCDDLCYMRHYNMQPFLYHLLLAWGNPPITRGSPSQRSSNVQLHCFSWLLAWTSCWKIVAIPVISDTMMLPFPFDIVGTTNTEKSWWLNVTIKPLI